MMRRIYWDDFRETIEPFSITTKTALAAPQKLGKTVGAKQHVEHARKSRTTAGTRRNTALPVARTYFASEDLDGVDRFLFLQMTGGKYMLFF